MSKNSRIKTVFSNSPMLGSLKPIFIEKGKTKKVRDKKKQNKEKRERVRQINNNTMGFIKRGKR